jgi:hypothetical protein
VGETVRVDVYAELDPQTAERARAAMDWMVGPEGGPEDLSQMQVQMFLWYALPNNWFTEDAEHHEIAWALGDVLAAAGRDRYAAICRDPHTHRVISAHHDSPEAGLRALREALAGSGLEPPDTDLLAWDSVTGPDERTVRDSVTTMLEEAIESGSLVTGARGWKAQAARLTTTYLTAPDATYDGRAPLDVVRDERARRWAQGGGPAWQRLHASVLPLLEEPEVTGVSLAPVRALLDGIGDGVTLTPAGYLPKALVLELIDRFGWYDFPGMKARSEADVVPLRELHALLRKARVVTKRGRKLTIARKGIDDDSRLFRLIAEQAMSGDDLDAEVAAVRAAVLLKGAVLEDELDKAVYDVVAERWRTTAGQPVEREDVTWGGFCWRSVARTLGWQKASGDWPARTLTLTDAGRAAAVLGLRARAYAPRHRP